MKIPEYTEARQMLACVRERYTQKELAALRVIASKPAKIKPESEFTFIDLFAGIGGIRMGFESQGGQCVYTSEWDSYAQKTYSDNFPDEHDIAGDITRVDTSEIPDHDVLLAGFPCQPFSLVGVSKKNALGRPQVLNALPKEPFSLM